MNRKKWVVISYFANMNSAPASIHCDDRLQPLINHGIEISLVSSMMGGYYSPLPHSRIFSLSPAGFRYELRHILKRKIKNKALYLCAFFSIFLCLFPIYIIECLLIRNRWVQLDLSWSWGISGGCLAAWKAWKSNADLIYSTGGSVSTQTAGLIASKLTGKPWLCETQDPLTYQYNPERPKELNFNIWLEKKIIRQAAYLIVLTQGAVAAAKLRHPLYPHKIKILRPGLRPFQGMPVPEVINQLKLIHLGTLDGTRNLSGFLDGAQQVLKKDTFPWHLDLYGHIGKIVHKQMEQCSFIDRMTWHGKVSREHSLSLMNSEGVLLLIQNASDVSTETIPSKVYEYLQANRLIFGLVYRSPELRDLLKTHGHIVAEVDQPEEIAAGLEDIIQRFKQSRLHDGILPYTYTLEDSVQQLMQLGCDAITSKELGVS